MDIKVRVLLCDDQTAIRHHLRRMLASTPGVQVVGEAAGGLPGVRMALELMPDLVVMDLSMPDLDGIQATRQILAGAPATKVLVFSAECGPEKVQQVLAAGACGYLVKSGNADELVHAIRTVMQGERYVSPAVVEAEQQKALAPRRSWYESPGKDLGARDAVRVLLVEDAGFVRERLAELLSALEGVEVVGQATDLAGATRLVAELRPDVVVLDLELEGQSGLDLLAKIGRRDDSPLVIVLTNYDYPVLRRGCAKLGADFYFYKPIEFERVTEVCQELARRARGTSKGALDHRAEPLSPNSNDSL